MKSRNKILIDLWNSNYSHSVSLSEQNHCESRQQKIKKKVSFATKLESVVVIERVGTKKCGVRKLRNINGASGKDFRDIKQCLLPLQTALSQLFFHASGKVNTESATQSSIFHLKYEHSHVTHQLYLDEFELIETHKERTAVEVLGEEVECDEETKERSCDSEQLLFPFELVSIEC